MKKTPTTWEELIQYIHTNLCEKENLIPEQFPLESLPLVRQNQFCGAEFSLFGPRQIRLGAVWSAERNTLFLYDSRGERFHTETFSRRFKVPANFALEQAVAH